MTEPALTPEQQISRMNDNIVFLLEESRQASERFLWMEREMRKWEHIADQLVRGILDDDIGPAMNAWKNACNEQRGIAP
jgi:hypothetical protein